TSGSDSFTLAASSSYITETFTLTAGKTLSNMSIILIAQGVLTGTFTLSVDFIFFFKETLTLPTAIRPLQEQKTRNIVEIPIVGREGGQVQDLGSTSPNYIIAGGLVNTT